MAGTPDDDITPSVFRLLCDEYALFLRRTGSSKSFADRLVEKYLEEGERDRDGRIRYKILEVHALPGGLTPSPYHGDFWRSYPERGIKCVIKPWDSEARWTGPASSAWKEFDGREVADYRVIGIRLNHDIVLEFLESAGLHERTQFDESEIGSTQPLPPESPPPPQPAPSPSPPAETASTVPAASQAETSQSARSEPAEATPEDRIATFLAWARNEYHHHVPKRKFKWIEAVAYPRMRNELGDIAPWDSAKSLKRAMYPSKDGK